MADTSPWLEEVGKGWRPIISPVLERLESDGILITQVKEKFGGLRIYVGLRFPLFTYRGSRAEVR